MKRTQLFIILFLTLCSCNSNKKDIHFVYYDLNGLISKDIKLNLSDYFTEIEYIIPEFSQDVIPGSYSKVKIIENHLLILDNLGRLFIYTRSGIFVGLISNKGRGPGEYITIIDFTILNGDVYLIDNALSILRYKLNGDFISETKLDVPQLGISCFYDKIMTYTMPPWSIENNWFKLTLYDKSLKILSRCYQGVKDEKLKESIPNFFFKLYKFNGVYSLWEGDLDTIFRLTEDFQINPSIFLNLGSKKDIYTMERLFDIDHQRTLNLIETADYFFVDCLFKKQGKSLFYDRKKGFGGNVVFNYNLIDHGFHNDIDGGYPFWPKDISDDGELFTWFDPLSFKKKFDNEYFKKIKIMYSNKAEYINKLINTSEEKLNPIIMICR